MIEYAKGSKVLLMVPLFILDKYLIAFYQFLRRFNKKLILFERLNGCTRHPKCGTRQSKRAQGNSPV